MKIVILKFGGTSLTTSEKKERIVTLVKRTLKEGLTPVVVVSAIGRSPDAYATDTLISLVNDNFRDNCLMGMDLLMSCGETIATTIIASGLRNNGIKTMPLTGFEAGIITDNNYGNAKITKFDQTKLMKILEDKIVPVIAGFQGISEEGFISTLGRGGSDITAAALGFYLKAKEVNIYTDVDGIMTSDPNISKDAKLIEKISYKKAYEMAINGAKVIHPTAITFVQKGKIPMYIKNILKDDKNTLIS